MPGAAESSNMDTPSASPPAQRVTVPHRPTAKQKVAALTLTAIIKSISATVRFRLSDRSGFFDAPPVGQAIYSCWHNRLPLCLDAYFKYGAPRTNTRGLAAMVSASRDGAFLSAVLEDFNVQPVRGSTSRRGRQALLEMTRWAERGFDLAITPDGPRGPCYTVQPGIISLAQVTGLPILPFSYHLQWKVKLKSWDRFQVPIPFTQCEVRAMPVVRVPREADDEERERLRAHLEQSMMAITED